MVYDEMVKPLCWVMGLILLYGWGFAIPFSDIYPEHRSVGNDTGKVVLFILYVVISEYGKKLDRNYKCPVYCDVDHKHIFWGKDEKKDEKETYIQPVSRLYPTVRAASR